MKNILGSSKKIERERNKSRSKSHRLIDEGAKQLKESEKLAKKARKTMGRGSAEASRFHKKYKNDPRAFAQ